MDPLTQGVLGATAAVLASRPSDRRRAVLTGFLAGCAADLDVFIPRGDDPLGELAFHRHFTHALLFIPIGALIVAAVLRVLFKDGFKRLYLFALLGYATHAPLDALTTYGTHLFWPFSGEVIGTGTIAIVDPLFTLILIGGLVLVLRSGATRRAPAIAASFAICYFALGFLQQHRADAAIAELAKARGHTRTAPLVKTTMGSLLVWRSVYVFEDHFYIDAVRVAQDAALYPGASIARFHVEPNAPEDVRRFDRFSRGYIASTPGDPTLLGDIRYSVAPNGLAPLWGLRIDPQNPRTPAAFEKRAQTSRESRALWWDMVLGR